MNTELFNVIQFLDGDYCEQVRSGVGAKEAVDAAYHYTHNVASMCGITRRVIITDMGDSVCFEWRQGEGVVFPEQIRQDAQAQRDYKKEVVQ